MVSSSDVDEGGPCHVVSSSDVSILSTCTTMLFTFDGVEGGVGDGDDGGW